MSNTDDRVVAIVEQALREDADLSSRELQRRAAVVDESVLELSGRQFHAKYALQVRRKIKDTSKDERSPLVGSSSTQAPAADALEQLYHEKRERLNEALHDAFRRALSADSVRRLNDLLAKLEAEIEAVQRL